MRGGLVLVVLAFAGLLGASSVGYAAYVVSKDSVGVPVTKLKRAPTPLAPAAARQRVKPRRAQQPPPPPPVRTTTGDDHGGGGDDDNSGKGSGNSGRGGGGDDDDD